MQKIIFTYLLLGTINLAFAQKSCCALASASSNDNMTLFLNDAAFVSSHTSPLPYQHQTAVGGEIITLDCPDGKKANAYFIKAQKSSKKWLFVYQEWWGLNDYIKKQADTFYQDLGNDVNILALDMYDGTVATNAEEAGKLMKAAQAARLEAIMQGGINYAGKKAKIATIGWCFGGGLSLKSALLEAKQAVGCVMYYGMPVSDTKILKALKCDVLGIFATEKWISKEIIETLRPI